MRIRNTGIFSNIAIFLVICLAAKLYIMWTLNVKIYTLNSRAITILNFYYFSFFGYVSITCKIPLYRGKPGP